MKFIVSSITLLKHLQGISGVLNSSNTLPILDNFLFEIHEGELSVSASDLETTMITKCNVEANENGRIAVPAKLLLETLKTFPEQPLTFTIDEANFAIEISSDFGKYKLAGQNADEFPRIPTIEGAIAIDLPAEVLLQAINKTLFATGNDDLRPVMSGVYCQLSPDNVTFAATDAHKLVRYRRTDARADTAVSFILPKKPLNLLKNILASSETKVKIEYNQTNTSFSFENYNLVCRLIDGKYPNYEAVIPVDNPNRMTIDRLSLLGSLRRVAVFTSKTTHQVRLKIAGSQVQISAEDLDFSIAANERLACQYDGADLEIGFNARFLIDMLSNLETEEVNLEMSVPNRAGLIIPVQAEDKKHEDILMLVMPVMLNN